MGRGQPQGPGSHRTEGNQKKPGTTGENPEEPGKPERGWKEPARTKKIQQIWKRWGLTNNYGVRYTLETDVNNKHFSKDQDEKKSTRTHAVPPLTSASVPSLVFPTPSGRMGGANRCFSTAF